MEILARGICKHCGLTTSGTDYCCQACQTLDELFDHVTPEILAEYQYLDSPRFMEKYRLKTGEYDFEFYIEGITCASCIHLIEKLPEYEPTVFLARLDFARSRLAIKVKESFSLARLLTLIKSWGYVAHCVSPLSVTKDISKSENKTQLKKIAVAAACTGNIMLFVIPVYSGLKGDLENIFNWMSFFLFLPILLYSATGFYQGAINSLRFKTINVDLPIAIALVSSFILSTANLIRGSGDIYYDSTAGFMFLILSSRYFLKRSQEKYLQSLEIRDIVQNNHFIKLVDNKETAIALDEIQRGDVLLIKLNDILPVDGELLGSSALVDAAVLNGEPLPRHYEQGMQILAGSKSLSPLIKIKVISAAHETQLSALITELKNGIGKKSKIISITDKTAQWLIASVFLIAIVFFTFYFQINPEQAFNRALALIVLACPCALAFGAPLTLNLAVKKAQNLGLLVKNCDVFERILKIKNIFFDKTGTLTEMELQLKRIFPESISDDIKAIIISLEQYSYHPIAFAFRNTWPEIKSQAIEDYKEYHGQGVQGKINGTEYSLGPNASEISASGTNLTLKKNGIAICHIYLETPVYPECADIIKNLKKRQMNCFLLSGDRKETALQIGTNCQILKENCFGDLSPLEKQMIVSNYAGTCMIGDGTNDALALGSSDIGIAVKGSTHINLQAADIYLTRAGLKPLIELFDLALITKKVLVRNLIFSLSYNAIGGGLALAGFVSPWLAAVLMPISSLIIIISTIWGFK